MGSRDADMPQLSPRALATSALFGYPGASMWRVWLVVTFLLAIVSWVTYLYFTEWNV